MVIHMQMDMVNINANFFDEPIGMKFPHFLQDDPEQLGYAADDDFRRYLVTQTM